MYDVKITVKNDITEKPVSIFEPVFTIPLSTVSVSIEDTSIFSEVDKEILWDFGDGTVVRGKTAKHYYKEPGTYYINCTFFDKEGNAHENTHAPTDHTVVVKDILDTGLRFTEEFKAACNPEEGPGAFENIYAGSTNKVAELIAVLGSQIKKDVPIKLTVDNSTTASIFDFTSKTKYRHLLPYHSFYDKDNNPIQEIIPVYKDVFVSLEEKDLFTNTVVFRLHFYIVDKAKEIKPDYINASFNGYITPAIDIIDSEEDIEDDVYYHVGRIGYSEIYFKDDLSSNHDNLFYVLDQEYFEDDNILLSKDSINLVSVGLTLEIKENVLKGDEIIFVSTNGLTSNNDITKLSIEDNIYSFECAKFIGVEAPFVIRLIANTKNPYFIKDVDISNIKINYNLINPPNSCNIDIKLNAESDLDNKKYTSMGSIMGSIMPRIETVSVPTSFCVSFNVGSKRFEANVDGLTFIDIKSFSDKDSQYYLDPKQNGEDFSVYDFWKTYQTHSVFQDKPVLDKYIYALFESGDFLKSIIDKGYNFTDDMGNIETCSIKNLLSIYDSIGNTIDMYNKENFNKPTDIGTLLKIISIRHNKLIGSTIKTSDEFELEDGIPGKNRGKEIGLTDNDKIYIPEVSGVVKWPKIVCYDKFAKQYTVLNTAILEKSIDNETIFHEDENGRYILLNEYFSTWGWNLLLGEYEYGEGNILTPSKNPYITELLTSKVNFVKAGQNIGKFYRFYEYIETDDTEVRDSYLEVDTISDNIKDYNKWRANDGSIDRLLYKALIENLNFA